MKHTRITLVCCLLLSLITRLPAEPVGTLIENFEDGIERWIIRPPASAWLDAETVHEGHGALRFSLEEKAKCLLSLETADWSDKEALSFWAWSPQASGAIVGLGLDSENPGADGWVYFYYLIPLDWEGWRHFVIYKSDFKTSRAPDWSQIKSFFLSTADWPDLTRLEIGAYLLIDDIRVLTSEEAASLNAQ